jgi:Uma2 family endonuclease
MSATIRKHMTADEFIAWATQQPDTEHYELVSGVVVAMAPERALHGRIKATITHRLIAAIGAARLQCETYVDSMAVRVSADTVYEPDVMVRCGATLDNNAVEVTDPIIVVEVVSPSSARRDTGSKLADYFSIPSVRHYLIVMLENPAIIHHRRDDVGQIATTILRDGTVRLDPPGLVLADLFAER